MNKRVLIDTNILIYAVDEDSIFHEKALKLLFNTKFDLYTTSKNISEFLVVLTRTDSIKIDIIEVLKILNNLVSNFSILYPGENSSQKLQELLKKYKPRGLKIHDFEIASIALVSGISQIATKNIDDFKKIKEISLINI